MIVVVTERCERERENVFKAVKNVRHTMCVVCVPYRWCVMNVNLEQNIWDGGVGFNDKEIKRK